MNTPTDWLSALAILAGGLLLGALVFSFARSRKSASPAKRQELEARRDALVQQLRDLGDDVADGERAWLERETAEVLRELDRLPETAAPSEPAAPPRRRSAAFGFAWGVACTLAAGAIGWYAWSLAGPKGNPDEQIKLAQDAFARNDLVTVLERTNDVLAQNPDEPRALTYNAVARMSMGEVEKAGAMLERATQRDPKLVEAWVALAQARVHAGRAQEAAAAIETAVAQHPKEEKRIREAFAAMQNHPPASELPPDHPPLAGREPAAAATSSQPIHVTMSLDPAIAAQGGILYVIARGGEAGHPVAVRRIETNAFPVSIDLGTGDTMMGGTLPEKVRIEARLDSDGDAGTNDPADPRASADGIAAGASVELRLARAN